MRKRKTDKVLRGLLAFLALMLLCTLISRAIYASGLPQVTVEKTRSMPINHEVKVSGTVKPARQLAQNVRAALLVREVFVAEGDSVEEGQLLFTLDTGCLGELIEEKELEGKKLELQIATLENNLALAGEEKTKEMQRALEDGAVLLSEADKRLERAKEDEAYAKRELSLYEADTPEDGSEEEWKLWEEGRKALSQKLLEAEREREDAQDAQEAAYRQAGRGLEDNFSMERSDAALGIARMEFEQVKKELAELRSLLKEEGKICAQYGGTVMQVGVAAGQNTTDSAAVTFADSAAPLQFEAIVDQEQKKYVEAGAQGELAFGSYAAAGGKKMRVTVDYLTEIDSMPGSFVMRALLTGEDAVIGQNATFSLNVQSENFSCCISMDALHRDENQRSFVWVVEEADTILGMELTARRRMVNVLDENGRYAAVETGVIDEDDRIIQAATREFGDGDVVRMKE